MQGMSHTAGVFNWQPVLLVEENGTIAEHCLCLLRFFNLARSICCMLYPHFPCAHVEMGTVIFQEGVVSEAIFINHSEGI